jgi:Uncharacterized protein involved in exopolysaccharide biosynthesis
MNEANEDYYSMDLIVDNLRAFLRYLRNKWWALVLCMVIGAGLGAVYYFIQKPKYEAVTTFILEDKSSSGGGLAGLASQFGFNLGSLSGGGSIFSGDNILDIIRSKKIVKQVLLYQADSTSSGSSLADLYLDFSGLKRKWQKKIRLTGINFNVNNRPLSPVQDSVLNVIYEQLIKKNISIDRVTKKGSIFKVQVTAPNGTFARMMTMLLVDEAGKMYMEIRTGTSQDNIRELQRRSDSLLIMLNRKSFSAAASQPLDINPALRTAVVPTEIAARDKTVLATLYAEVTKNLEASKMLLSQQTPVIQLLDSPEYLLSDHKKKLPVLVIISSFVAVVIFVAGAFALFYKGNVMGQRKIN